MIRALGIVLVCIAGAYWLAFLLVAHVVPPVVNKPTSKP